MGERWTGEQIALVITGIDRDAMTGYLDLRSPWALSRELVLRFAQQPQRPSIPLPPPVPIEEKPAAQPSELGKCVVCKTAEAVLLTEFPTGSQKVQGYCLKDVPQEDVEATAGA